MVPKICSVPDCDNAQFRRVLCNRHYKRLLRHGDPLGGGMSRDRRPITERFATGYSVTPSGCWEWNHSLDANGYGELRELGRHIAAHRYSYARATGRDEFGDLDHSCRNRKCVNPSHLREVTTAQNQQNLATIRATRSGYRGVAWHEASQSWHVVAVHRGRQYSGGYFKDVHKAGRAAIELRNSLYTHNEEDRKLTA